jgi:UDP-N-acetylglucosamine--N-acetylmuramyl-(pentapeptide) pyrophosphoryl-undecaprenol N-acetylglucosamine transferase
MRILLAGGGSGGPVSPVLAVAAEIKKLKPHTEFLFIGTKKGPERAMVEAAGIRFDTIPAAKWRRYFSIKNIFSPFVLIAGFFKSLNIIRKFRPDAVFGAGSFVAVPVAWAARGFRVPIIMHQQDTQIGLANRLIAPFADKITTAFEETSKDFYSGSGLLNQKLKPRAQWVGNPVRPELTIKSKADVKKYFNLHDDLPILLILGGATGAEQINQLVGKILPELVQTHQVIHKTGQGKNILNFQNQNYHPFELIPFEPYAAILKAAHLVVARAGLSTIAELSALGKTAIIIPMPRTHQEDNAKLVEAYNAAIVLFSQKATPENLKRVINGLKFDQQITQMLAKNIENLMPKNAAVAIAKSIINEH